MRTCYPQYGGGANFSEDAESQEGVNVMPMKEGEPMRAGQALASFLRRGEHITLGKSDIGMREESEELYKA